MKRVHVLSLVIAVATFMPVIVLAQGAPGALVQCNGIDCKCSDLVATAQRVLYLGIYLAVFFSAVLFAYAGWQMLTAHSTGDTGKIKNAKEILWYVIIGLVVILASWLIVNTLFTSLTNSKGLGNICP